MKKLSTLLFFALLGINNINAGTFTSVASGAWNTASTWSVLGGDVDGIPDSDDDVTIASSFTVTFGSSNICKSLTFNIGGVIVTNGNALDLYGNMTIPGPGSGFNGVLPINFRGSAIFSCPNYTFTNNSTWTVYAGTLTIPVGTNVSRNGSIVISDGATVVNNSNYTFTGGQKITTFNTGVWVNAANSNLRIDGNFTGSGTLNASASGNTVIYGSSYITTIKNSTYYNLTINGVSSKTLQPTGILTVLNDFLFTAGSINLNNNNMVVSGNWSNTANSTILNQGSITFNPSSTKTISRTTSNEVFTNMIVNGSGTVQLNRSLTNGALTITSGTLDVSASNFTVNLSGNLTNNSFINTRQGLFNFNGSSAQTISGSSSNLFYDLALNNSFGLTVNSILSLSNALTVTNGNFNSNGNVTLISNSSTTARIATVGAGGSFSNNMIIQKHISARAANYHDFSTPVQGTTIYDWDDEMYMSGFSTVDSPAGITGVDGSAGGFQSVLTYDEPTSTYPALTNSLTTLIAGKGYEIWCADDNTNWFAKTIDTRGVPNYGTQSIGLSFTSGAGANAGYNLIGNPFASPIDYSLVTKTNTDGHAYGYNNGVWTDFGINAVLTPHQGFWVYATSTGASVSIPESAKASNSTTSFYRVNPNYAIKLSYSSPNLQYLSEGTVNFDSNASTKWDVGMDALFMSNSKLTAATISFKADDKNLLTNAINDNADETFLPLELFSPISGIYYIDPSVLSLGAYKYAWVENTKTGAKFELNQSIPINIEKPGTNNDYVLRLSKESENSTITQSVFANDILVFNTESSLNIKSQFSDHLLSKITIIDLSGKIVLEQINLPLIAGQIEKLDLSNLAKGLYIVHIVDELNNSVSRKILR